MEIQNDSKHNVNFATKRLLDSVWTVSYIFIDANSVCLVSYDRDNKIGYDNERSLPKCRLVEDDKRTVMSIFINEHEFEVVNKRNVFSYSRK